MPSPETALLIIGAGPFGLAMAAHAGELGIDHVVVGRSMSFWGEHMPAGMMLRSGCDWHLDPAEHDTIERFLATRGQRAANVEPLPLSLYLEYAAWFEATKGIRRRRSPPRTGRGSGRSSTASRPTRDGIAESRRPSARRWTRASGRRAG